ncbi:uncharacterized protein LOC6615539 [Drosophila sechellia]|uniref:GM15921 n=1 Tax=Drosophila sechellia TaxID=7238 RepID=B4I858_DROSE|nr:uncharacterized protein LOC6615539 [Drosophila sechellia]EDW56783.1 GM15921 [Drosophila sechellia]
MNSIVIFILLLFFGITLGAPFPNDLCGEMAEPNNSVTIKTEEFLLENENITFGLHNIPHFIKHLIANVDREIPGKRNPNTYSKNSQNSKNSSEMDYVQTMRFLIETTGRWIGLLS